MSTVNLPLAAHKVAANVFSIITHPCSVHIITSLQQKNELTTIQLTTQSYRKDKILRHLNLLRDIGAVRRESLGSEVYYKLVNGRIETINGAAARLL